MPQTGTPCCGQLTQLLRDKAVFKCASQERHLPGLYSLEWVDAWLKFEMERIRPGHFERQGEHIVLYLALLRDLNPPQCVADVKIFNKEEHIEVGLVIDVGNSRTSVACLQRPPELLGLKSGKRKICPSSGDWSCGT